MPKEMVFEIRADPIEVTSIRRPDTSWRFTDAAGHLHAWHAGGKPADSYNPSQALDLPTLRWVVDGTAYYPDGDPYEYGHHECILCGENVQPRMTADDYRQFVPGIRRCYVDGRQVTPEEFERLIAKAHGLDIP